MENNTCILRRIGGGSSSIHKIPQSNLNKSNKKTDQYSLSPIFRKRRIGSKKALQHNSYS